MLRLGLDIGGTKIEGLLLDAQGGVLCRRRIATPTQSYPEFLHALLDFIVGFGEEATPPFSIGIGLPGAVRLGVLQPASQDALQTAWQAVQAGCTAAEPLE